MPTYSLRKKDFFSAKVDNEEQTLLKSAAYQKFNPNLLGLGDLLQPSVSRPAIAAVFDLQGFTVFCSQVDPEYSLPSFLRHFLNWLFGQIKEEMTDKIHADGVVLWSPLPFFVKFMGDGLLVLWDTSDWDLHSLRNIVISMRNICNSYPTQFLSNFKKSFSLTPAYSQVWYCQRDRVFDRKQK